MPDDFGNQFSCDWRLELCELGPSMSAYGWFDETTFLLCMDADFGWWDAEV